MTTLAQRPANDQTDVWIVPTALLEPHAARLRSLAGEDSPRALGRGYLRLLLGAQLGIHPHDVAIERRCPACGGPHGPPTAADLRISVSYTTGRIAYALAPSPVGIDIERKQPQLPWQEVAPLVLTDAQLDQLHTTPPRHRPSAFLHAWTRREAIGKATGVGLIAEPPDHPLHVESITTDGQYIATVAHATPRLTVCDLSRPAPSDE